MVEWKNIKYPTPGSQSIGVYFKEEYTSGRIIYSFIYFILPKIIDYFRSADRQKNVNKFDFVVVYFQYFISILVVGNLDQRFFFYLEFKMQCSMQVTYF